MSTLTRKEKADRFDALQTTFKYTKEIYKRLKKDADERKEERHEDAAALFGAYDRGLSDAFEHIIKDLDRWIMEGWQG